MKRGYVIALTGAAAMAIAVCAGVFLFYRGGGPSPQMACGNTVPSYWYDPMHPSEHFDKPGKSPFMDMQLAPKCPESTALPQGVPSPSGSVAIDSRMVQNLGIRLSVVEQGSFERGVDTIGLVGVDEHRIEAIQVRESGWVEELEIRAAGDSVRRGQKLAGVYSPQLLAAQQELLIAHDSHDPGLIEAAHRRLLLFGLSEPQIAHIEHTGRSERRVAYYAPLNGYVMNLGARQGAAVEPGTTLFQLAALDSVWVTAEVPEMQAAWIKPGDPAELEVSARPGEHFTGQVDYLYPELARATRSLEVRVVVKNPHEHLRPGMFATVHFRGAPLKNVLTVPSEAVIKTGTRSIVIVADDATHFRPVVVQVGTEHGERSQILDGLSLGRTIVASGQFLIDSEANLRGAFENLAGAGESIKRDLMPSPTGSSTDRSH